MPSIPQSLLWISLVVLWLFVLVPMLISKREAVRRTSDVALATRVLNGGASSRLVKRGGPAAGHRSDPDWKHQREWDHEAHDDDDDEDDAEPETDQIPELAHGDDEVAQDTGSQRAVIMKVAATRDAAVDEPDYLDVDVVEEDSGVLCLGPGARSAQEQPTARAAGTAVPEAELDGEEEPVDEPQLADEPELADDSELDTAELFAARAANHEHAEDDYEYMDDTSGLEAQADDEEGYEPTPRYTSGASRRRRYDTKTAAAVSARKYAFRKRMLVAMAVVLVGSAIAAFEVTAAAWWLCSAATVVTMLYLAYLRRQTRIEAKVRRRRMQRQARARLGVENTHDRDYDVVPSRLRRPGAVVLEIDDEDPIFEHLDYAGPVRGYGWPRDLPRAVGQ